MNKYINCPSYLSVKQMNKQMIAVLQFIFSVAAGFAFGFIGLELMIGDLDFGFRLLMGIIIALIIALAEIYFLAKKLNEDYDLSVETLKLNDASGKAGDSRRGSRQLDKITAAGGKQHKD